MSYINFALQEYAPYLEILLLKDIQQQKFDFQCPIPWEFNQLSLVTTVTMVILLCPSTSLLHPFHGKYDFFSCM